MVDADLGWHLLLTTVGTEAHREIRINPAVDLPDEIHPVYGDDDMGLARATAAIDEAAHYRDDVTATCPLGLGASLGDVASVPVDGVAVVGQVESITWTATPDGMPEQAVIRRHVAIAPEAYVAPELPIVADDTGATTHLVGTSGNVLANDEPGLTVVAVNGFASNIGVEVEGDNGGLFLVSADGAWSFDPDGDFGLLGVLDTAETSITYHANNGTSEATAEITVIVSRANAAPVAVNDTGAVAADTTTSGNVITNDTDSDGDTLSVSAVGGSSSNVGVAVSGSSGGLFTIASDGAWTFDPAGDFDSLTGDETATTSISYHVSDGVANDEGTLTVTVSAAPVGTGEITYIGSSSNHIQQSTAASYTLSLPAGTQAGDLVLIAHGFVSIGDLSPTVLSSGWTKISDLFGNGTYDANLGISYKFVGADETTAEINAVGTVNNYPAAAVAYTFRGVASIVLDVPIQTATGAGNTNANPPAITPVTDNAVVICVSAGSGAPLSPAAPTGFGNAIIRGGSWSYAYTVGMANRVWTDGDGAIDPAVWTVASTSSARAWCAASLALRPA
jgi:VCBS repeat-containing protein